MPNKQPEPEDDESYQDFMDRCVAETDDEEACQMAWEDRAAPAVMHKTHAGQIDGTELYSARRSPRGCGSRTHRSQERCARRSHRRMALA